MNAWTNMALPKPTKDLERCKRDLSDWGYCIVADVVDAEERKRARDRLDEQARLEREQGVAWLGNGGRGGNTWLGYPKEGEPEPVWQGIRTLVNKGRPFIDLIMNAKIRDLMKHTFGKHPYYLMSANGLIIRKGAVAMFTHTDQQMVPFSTPIPVIANAMVCLSDFTEANGATRVVPGSHKNPDPPLVEVDVKARHAYNPAPIESVPAEAPAGSAIIFEGRLWHSSGASLSDDVRYSITIAYMLAWLRQQDCYPASLHDDIYAGLSDDERSIIGFQDTQLGRLDPRFPGDRSNVGTVNAFIPELRPGSEKRAIPVERMQTVGGAYAAMNTDEKQ